MQGALSFSTTLMRNLHTLPRTSSKQSLHTHVDVEVVRAPCTLPQGEFECLRPCGDVAIMPRSTNKVPESVSSLSLLIPSLSLDPQSSLYSTPIFKLCTGTLAQMDDPDACEEFFTPNPDIIGIGVRLGFYIQIAVTVVQSRSKDADLTGPRWALGSMAFGLMVAAVVLAVQKQLSFFNAYQVQYLLGISNVALNTLHMAAWRRSIKERTGERVVQERRELWGKLSINTAAFYAQATAALVLTTILWVNARTFGQDPQCISQMHFYISFWRITASDPLYITKVITFIAFFFAMIIPLLPMIPWVASRPLLLKLHSLLNALDPR